MKSTWFIVAAALSAACNGGANSNNSGSSGGGSALTTNAASGASDVDSGVAPVVAQSAADGGAAPVVAPARLSGVPSRLAEGEGVIMAASAGGVVRMTREGAPAVELRDGERVRVVTTAPGMGESEQNVEVEVRSMRGSVPNTAVITEESLHRSSDGRWAIVHALESCGDFCHAQLTLLGPDGARRSLCGNEPCAGPELIVAFSPDGSAVAVGSDDLRVTTLSETTTRTVSGFGSPVYAPQGRLFARSLSETDDGVYEVVAAGDPRRVFAAPGRPPRQPADVPRSPLPPAVLEQNGTVLCADFFRGRVGRVVRVTLDGRAVAGTQRCAATR
ncbi:MAG: hypothetical protein JNK05_32330 [Myxococcales bacterium]|nr:hypothetical protein [Myxococcales bacterium]